ncbi:hypothetical protein [Sinimarinibacterium flocculans]|uniref:hypothetical protein n=1 Tax=Sinimarinibacterium flocculans TaxID=985250 RepID=UPI00248F5F3E|nr:hypothetical protein [Sinimarinibacterium flocculans]
MTTTETSVAPVIVALEGAYDRLAREFDLPPVTIVVATGADGRSAKWGHFAPERYVADDAAPRVDEILIAAESLSREPHETFGTLVHEAAHAFNRANGIQDTSRGNRYHNKRFKKTAESFGLSIGFDPSIGHSPTTVPQETRDAYAKEIQAIADATQVFRAQAPQASRPKARNNPKLTCECGFIIRASQSVIDATTIMCGSCQTWFTQQDD